jgi:hypothetical protein
MRADVAAGVDVQRFRMRAEDPGQVGEGHAGAAQAHAGRLQLGIAGAHCLGARHVGLERDPSLAGTDRF